MALQNPKLFGYEVAAALTDVSNKSLALRRLNLPPFDLEVIRGSTNAGMIPNDWRSFSRLSVPIIKTVDRYNNESGQYTNLVNQRAGTNTALFGNLNVNGSISGKAIRYNYVDFDDSNKVKIAIDLLPVLKTFVAPIFLDPIFLISLFMKILVRISPNGIEPSA